MILAASPWVKTDPAIYCRIILCSNQHIKNLSVHIQYFNFESETEHKVSGDYYEGNCHIALATEKWKLRMQRLLSDYSLAPVEEVNSIMEQKPFCHSN